MHSTFSYTTTMDSTATESPDLNQEDRMTLAIAHLRAHPDQSIRQVAKTFQLPRTTLQRRLRGRISSQVTSQAQQKLSVIKEDSLIKWINTMASWGWPPRVKHLKSMAKDILKSKGKPTDLGQHWYKNFLNRHLELKARFARGLN